MLFITCKYEVKMTCKFINLHMVFLKCCIDTAIREEVIILLVDNSNNITIIKGDTVALHINIDNYNLHSGDTVIFMLSTIRCGCCRVKKSVDTFNEDGSADIILNSSDTALRPNTYAYDIQVILEDGRVETIISSNFIVKGKIEDA